jgi:hypothetical protein
MTRLFCRLITIRCPEECYWVLCVWVWSRTSTVEGLKQLGLSSPPTRYIFVEHKLLKSWLCTFLLSLIPLLLRKNQNTCLKFCTQTPFLLSDATSVAIGLHGVLVTRLVRLPALTVRPEGVACRRVTSNPFSDTLNYVLFCKVRINFHPDIKQRVKLCFVCIYIYIIL